MKFILSLVPNSINTPYFVIKLKIFRYRLLVPKWAHSQDTFSSNWLQHFVTLLLKQRIFKVFSKSFFILKQIVFHTSCGWHSHLHPLCIEFMFVLLYCRFNSIFWVLRQDKLSVFPNNTFNCTVYSLWGFRPCQKPMLSFRNLCWWQGIDSQYYANFQVV